MINIVQDTVNDVVVFLTPTKTYFLLKFVKEDTGAIKRVICTNSTTYAGAINLQLEEVSSGTEDILNGKVQLGNGGWDLYLYEQASSTNINENLATYLHHEDCYVTGTATAMSSPRCKPVQVLDGTTLTEVASGGAYTCTSGVCADGAVVIKDSAGTILKTEPIPSGVSEDIIITDGNCEVFNTNLDMVAQGSILAEGYLSLEAPDGIVRVRKSDNTIIESVQVASGDLVFKNIANSTVNVNKSNGTLISAVSVLAESTTGYNVANSTAVLKDTAGNILSTTGILATESQDITAPDAVYRNNASPTYTQNIRSGQTFTAPQITLTQPNGSTGYHNPNINLSCTQINALADSDLISQLTNAQVQAVIEGRVTCKPINPNFQNIHSSILPSSYATGDWRSQYNAGYINNITYSELDRVYMLDNALNLSAYTPNPFGHTKRFTGRTGSYYDEVSNTWKDKNGSGVADHATAFPNGAVYDHYTGRAFQSTLNALGSSINFADTASAAAALTTNGLTWRIPTIAEHLSSVAVTIALNTSSINPSCHFNTTTGKIFIHATAALIAWCADVQPSNTENNYCVRYTTTTSLVVSNARTTASSRGGFAVANFTTSDLTL